MEKLDIISYKHDGELHRVWKGVVKIYESKDLIVLINNEVEVVDGDGRMWHTREPAVCYFFRQHWFNIICMIRNNGIYYYCNLSSPFVMDHEGLKYIDYDLDVKVFPDGEILELDRDEYDFNVEQLHYSDKIVTIIEKNLKLLLDMIEKKEDPFNETCVHKWYQEFLSQSKIKKEN